LEESQAFEHPEVHGVQADVSSSSLVIPFGSQIDYYLKIPKRAFFTLDGIAVDGSADATLSGELIVCWQTVGGAQKTFRFLSPSSRPLSYAFSNDIDEISRISFRAESKEKQTGGATGLRLMRPVLRQKARKEEFAARSATLESSGLQRGGKPNTIIYLIDTLRADHLGYKGYTKPTSPNLDAFAHEAVAFETAIAQSSWTKPSVASIFTGLRPLAHGANDTNDVLAPQARTLAKILSGAGYETVAFTTNPYVSHAYGLDQGFEKFVHLAQDNETASVYQPSNKLNEQVFLWLQERQEKRPFFLYVHAMDPHSPYAPPNEYRQSLAPRGVGSTDSVRFKHWKIYTPSLWPQHQR